ncbi:beta strand repeat-containing protein, partial [Cellulophaga baltica]|uniref:beta strand repeat-containing protein n=1 Tax=Cellulophaga baltica TaxID=76594 RepID=UPI0024952BE8
MKTITKYILASIALLALIIACTKEIGLYTEVEFEITEEHEADGYISTPLATFLKITPEELLEDLSYSFSFKINSGAGYFEDVAGSIIQEGEKASFNPLSASLDYIPTSIGDHSVTFTASDTFGFTEEITLTYSITNIPVTWTAEGPTVPVLLGSSQSITLTLGNEAAITGATYQRNYSFSEGSGNLYTAAPESNTIAVNDFVNIAPGTYQLEYISNELGVTTIEFLLRDSNEQELITTVTFEVVDELSSEKEITSFIVNGVAGTITGTAIDLVLPEGTNLTALAPVIIHTGASISPESEANQDFSSPVIYTVTAQDETIQAYTVNCSIVNPVDTTAPVITLVGADVTIAQGQEYTDQGATALDDVDGDISADIVIDNTVDKDIVGMYTVTYNVSDAAGNAATEVIRTVTVTNVPDTTAPVITRNGPASITLTVGDTYNDAGATALDDVDGDITTDIVIDNTVNKDVVGTYTVTYNVSDDAGNAATEVIRTVTVTNARDTTAPVITLVGADVTINLGQEYTDQGATALDDVDGDITADIVVVNPVDKDAVGTYTVTYNVSDAAGNAATEVIRTVTVTNAPDTTAPVITRNGPASIILTVGDTYADQGATALDDVDGDITADIVVVSPVNKDVVGTYTVTYNVSDAAGNAATEVIRTVTVTNAVDTTAPVITRNGPATITLTVGDTYNDAGATALDNVDGDITADIVIDNTVNKDVVGTYTVTYNVSDAAGNAATEVIRTVTVTNAPDTTAPVITRNGPATITLTVGDTYNDAGATALDNVDGDITADIVVVSPVNKDVVGTYTVTYNVSDDAGNAATEVIRTVTVINAADTTAPVITRNGPATITLTVGDTYNDAGATALDNVDGDITADIVIDNTVNKDVVGTYNVTYNVSDAAGNAATEVIRTVTVTSAPNQDPLANHFTVTVVGNTTNNSINVASEISDPDGDTLIVTIGSPLNGTAAISGTTINYNPTTGFTGNDQLTYTINDGNGGTDSGVITIAVSAPANQNPVANDFTVTV